MKDLVIGWMVENMREFVKARNDALRVRKQRVDIDEGATIKPERQAVRVQSHLDNNDAAVIAEQLSVRFQIADRSHQVVSAPWALETDFMGVDIGHGGLTAFFSGAESAALTDNADLLDWFSYL